MNFTKIGNNLLVVSWIAAIGTIVATTTIIYYWSIGSQKERKKRGKNWQTPKSPSEFVEAGKVEELYIFPIKSCKPNKVELFYCIVLLERKMKIWRSNGWIVENVEPAMAVSKTAIFWHALIIETNTILNCNFVQVVDSMLDNLFLTARIYPKMVLIEAHVFGQTLQVHFPKGNSSEIDTIEENDDLLIEVDLEEVRERHHVRIARCVPVNSPMSLLFKKSRCAALRQHQFPFPFHIPVHSF